MLVTVNKHKMSHISNNTSWSTSKTYSTSNPSLIAIPLQPTIRNQNFSNYQKAKINNYQNTNIKQKTKKYANNSKQKSYSKQKSNRTLGPSSIQNYQVQKVKNQDNEYKRELQDCLYREYLSQKDNLNQLDIGGWKDQNHNVLAQKCFNTSQFCTKSSKGQFSFIKANKKNIRTSKYKQKQTFRVMTNFDEQNQDVENEEEAIKLSNNQLSNQGKRKKYYTSDSQKNAIMTIQYQQTQKDVKKTISKSFQFSNYCSLKTNTNYHKNKQNYQNKAAFNTYTELRSSYTKIGQGQVKNRLNSLQRQMLMSPINQAEFQNDKTAQLKQRQPLVALDQFQQCKTKTQQGSLLVIPAQANSYNQQTRSEFNGLHESERPRLSSKQSHINLLKKQIQYLDSNQNNFFQNGKWERYPTSEGFYKPFSLSNFYKDNYNYNYNQNPQGVYRPKSTQIQSVNSQQFVGVYLQKNQLNSKNKKQTNPFLIIEGVTTTGSKTHAASMYCKNSVKTKKSKKNRNPRSSSYLLNNQEKYSNSNTNNNNNPNSSFCFSKNEDQQKIQQFNAIHSKMDLITPFKKLYQNKKNLIKKSQHLNISITQLEGRKIKKIIDYMSDMNEQKVVYK